MAVSQSVALDTGLSPYKLSTDLSICLNSSLLQRYSYHPYGLLQSMFPQVSPENNQKGLHTPFASFTKYTVT